MSDIKIKKCDLCTKDYRNDQDSYWADCVDPIHINMKNHAGLQCEWVLDVCTDCGKDIRDAVAIIVNKLKIK